MLKKCSLGKKLLKLNFTEFYFKILQYVILDVIGRFLRMGTETKPPQSRPSQVEARKNAGNGDVAKGQVPTFFNAWT